MPYRAHRWQLRGDRRAVACLSISADNRPTPTAPPHRANPTQWRRHIAPTPPRLRCPCTTPLSDRPLHTPPPTPCPIMGHTQASLCDRPCPGSELRSLTPCPPPSPERGLPQPQRATPAPSPQLISLVLRLVSPLFCSVGLYAHCHWSCPLCLVRRYGVVLVYSLNKAL